MESLNNDLFRGKRVYLTAEDTQVMAEMFFSWNRDAGYWRLLTSEPAITSSVKTIRDWIEKELGKDPSDQYVFMIRTLSDNRIIGHAGLDGLILNQGEGFVFIGLGEREYWGKGYGTDAMKIILRFAFDELNLHRVSLDVFEFNPRAVRSYEKAGFTIEGRARNHLLRDGRRWDMIYMGILRSEWQKMQTNN